MSIDFPDKLGSTRRDRKLVDADAIDGVMDRSQLPADLGHDEEPGLVGVRTESITFQDLTATDTDIELDPIQSNPIKVEHGDGAAELLTGPSNHDFTVATGLYLLTAEGDVGGNAVGVFELEIRDASDDSVIAVLSEVPFHDTKSVQKPFTAVGYWHPKEDTEINVLVNRHGLTCSFTDVKLSFSRLAHIPVQPDAFNVIFVASAGDDTKDGRTLAKAVQSTGKALELAKAFMPATDHRTIFTLEAASFADMVNNDTEGNVANLVVDARASVWESIDLTRKTNMLCRRSTGNVILGSGSQLEIWGSLGYTDPTTVSFVAGAHNGTTLKVRSLLANATLSFAGVTSGSRIRVEIDNYPVADFEATMKTLLDTIPDGVEVTGWIGKHNFGIAASAPPPDYSPVQAIEVMADMRHTGKLLIGADGENFVRDGDAAVSHWTDVASFGLEGLRIGSTLTGKIYLQRHVSGVSFPANYYYRYMFDSSDPPKENGIVPTTDGTDTAPSDLRVYIGSGHRLFYTHTEENSRQLNDRYFTHTLRVPNINYSQSILSEHQDDDLQLVFNFPDWDLDLASFIGQLRMFENTGHRSDVWNGKTRVRLNRVSKNRYTLTLGDDSSFLAANMKVTEFFDVEIHGISVNPEGSHPNQVLVSGQSGLPIPYIPNSLLVAEVDFSVETVDKDAS